MLLWPRPMLCLDRRGVGLILIRVVSTDRRFSLSSEFFASQERRGLIRIHSPLSLPDMSSKPAVGTRSSWA